MHNHMGVRQFLVNFFNRFNRQNFAVRFAGKFISAVRCADGNRQSVKMCFGNKTGCLVRIGYQAFFVDNTFSAVAVFFIAFAGFQRTDNTQLALNRSTNRMSAGNNFFGYADIVFIRRRGLPSASREPSIITDE